MAPVFLPPEIIQRIIHFLTHDRPPSSRVSYWDVNRDAGQYACVDRFWQDAIERDTFAELRLNLRKLEQVNSIVTPRRRQFVRRLYLYVQLRPGPRTEPEFDDERLRNNQILQTTFEAFLLALGQWTATEVHRGGIEMTLLANLPREERPSSPMWRTREAQWEHKYKRSVLELTDHDRIAQLPPATAINKVSLGGSSSRQRHFSVLAISALLARLPAVRSIDLDWWRSYRFAGMRNDLADALSLIKHPVDTFALADSACNSGDYPITPETFWEGEDRLSNSIRILSQSVTDLMVNDIAVTDEIFYPRKLLAGVAEPRWNSLVYFCLHYQPIYPSGELLFLPDPNASDNSGPLLDEVDSDDTVPHESPLNIPTPAIQQLHLAAARAALQMPVLQEMELEAMLGFGKYWHKFCYLKGKKLSAKAIWTSSSGWTPEDDVVESWRKVSRKHLNKELEVTISDDEHAIFYGTKG